MDQFLDQQKKNRVFNVLFTLAIVLIVFVGALAVNAIKENRYIGRGTYATNVITVSGKGEVMAVPDTGSFSFSVIEEAKTVADAQTAATKKTNSIIDALKAMGVDEKDIKTTGYNAYAKYDYGPNICTADGYCRGGKQVLTGYEVNQTITVKVRKTADAGAALTKVGDLGASNISGLSFVIDDMDAVQAEARDKAISDAQAKAKELSKSLGVRLSKIVNFSESGNEPIYYGMSASKVMGMGGDSAPVPQVPVGENTITSNVMITYEVE